MAELVLSALAHAALGIVLAAATWLVGLSTPPGLGRTPGAAYALGLVAVVAAAFLGLLAWPLGVAALAVVVAAVARGVAHASRDRLDAAVGALLRGAPGILGFGLALGLFQHGPTETRGSNAFGDLVFYVAEIESAARSVVPFRDLSLAGYEHTYLQSAPALVGGALSAVPGFDPFLFLASTLPAFALAALAIGAGFDGQRAQAPLLAALLALGSFAYPTWLSESAPVAFAAGCAFALAGLATRPTLSAGAAVAAALVLTKGVALVPLVAVVAVVAVPRAIHGSRRDRAAAAVTLAAVAAVVGVAAATAGWLTELLAFELLPADAVRGVRAQLDRRSTIELAPAALVVGHALLVAGVAALRSRALLAAVGAAVGTAWVVGGHGADAAFLIAALAVAVEVRKRTLDRRAAVLLGAGGAALVLAAWFREVAGLGTGATLLALAAVALAGAFSEAPPVRAGVALAGAAAVVVAIAAAGGALRLTVPEPPLTPEHHELAERVARLPDHALVLTSLTGEEIVPDEGWNYFSATSGREHYVAGWANSELRVRPEALARRLELNRDALAGDVDAALADLGETSPRPLFAVVRSSEPAPAGGRRLYSNARFALYELGR